MQSVLQSSGSRFTLFVYLQCNLCRIWEEWRPGDENRHLVCEYRCGGLCGRQREEVKTEEIWEPGVKMTRVTCKFTNKPKLKGFMFCHLSCLRICRLSSNKIPSNKQLIVQEELSANVEFVSGDDGSKKGISSVFPPG